MRIDRRRLLGALCAAAIVPAARGQGRVQTLGYLSNGAHVSMFAKPLAEYGFIEGANLRLEMRVAPAKAGQQRDRLADELVRAPSDVLIAFGAANIDALARATKTIPIVCGGTADPVGVGYAKSLRRPGGNITGLSYGVPEMAEILVGTVRMAKPGVRRIATIVGGDPEGGGEGWRRILRSVEQVAGAGGIEFRLHAAQSLKDIEGVLDRLDPRRDAVYFVTLPPGELSRPSAAACIRRRLFSTSTSDDHVRAGMLMHYSINHADPNRKVAAIAASLLRGARAADTPFELPDRTVFIVNRATARAIGLELPPAILARATEVID